jgi:hypothetical protein
MSRAQLSAFFGLFLALPLTGAIADTSSVSSVAGPGTALSPDECDVSAAPGSSNACVGVAGNAVQNTTVSSSSCGTSTSCFDGARSDAGQSAKAPIDVWNFCRYVDNKSDSAVFVPFRSAMEWAAFRTNPPASLVSLVDCSRPMPKPWNASWLVALPPYAGSGCGDDNSQGVGTPNVYVRYLSPSSPPGWVLENNSFTCHKAAYGFTRINSQVVWTGLDSDNYNPSWTPTVYYGPDVTLAASPNPVVVGSPITLTWTTSTGDPKKTPASEGTSPVILNETLWTTPAFSVEPSWTTASLQLAGVGTTTPSVPNPKQIYSITATGNYKTAAGEIKSISSTAYVNVNVIPNTCTATTIFGDMCSTPQPGKAHAYLYDLSSYGTGYQTFDTPDRVDTRPPEFPTASISHLTRQDRLPPPMEFYTNTIDIPGRVWTAGFPGYPQLQAWFGVCYDGGYVVNESDTQNYTIYTLVDDAVAIWIDGNLLGQNITSYDQTSLFDYGLSFALSNADPHPPVPWNVSLAPGKHRVLVKYVQMWPDYLGLQVWAVPAGQTFNGSAAQIMGLVDPPGPYMCP